MTSRLTRVGYTLPSRQGEGLEAKHRVALILQCSGSQPSTSDDTGRVSRLTSIRLLAWLHVPVLVALLVVYVSRPHMYICFALTDYACVNCIVLV